MASTRINHQTIKGEVTAASATMACTNEKNTVEFTTKS